MKNTTTEVKVNRKKKWYKFQDSCHTVEKPCRTYVYLMVSWTIRGYEKLPRCAYLLCLSQREKRLLPGCNKMYSLRKSCSIFSCLTNLFWIYELIFKSKILITVLLPHRRLRVRSPALGHFCLGFACSSYVCMDSVQAFRLSPASQRKSQENCM